MGILVRCRSHRLHLHAYEAWKLGLSRSWLLLGTVLVCIELELLWHRFSSNRDIPVNDDDSLECLHHFLAWLSIRRLFVIFLLVLLVRILTEIGVRASSVLHFLDKRVLFLDDANAMTLVSSTSLDAARVTRDALAWRLPLAPAKAAVEACRGYLSRRYLSRSFFTRDYLSRSYHPRTDVP